MKKTISKMILMLVMIAIACVHSQAQVTVINYDNSTSTGGRAPNGRWLFSNVVYLIKPSEMSSSGYGANIVTSVGWLYNLVSTGSQNLVTTGTLDVYLQNTTDAAYNKSSSFAASLPGMTKIISTTISIPMTFSTFTIDVPAGGPGTSTFSTIAGQGLYIAFAYHTTSALSTTSAIIACNSGGLNPGLYNYASQTDNGDLMGPTAFRPVTRLGHVCDLSAPTISGNTSFCAGGSTILDAGSGYAAWLWSTGATTQTISVTTAGTFTVTVTDVNQCTESSSTTTIVIPIPDVNQPANQTVCNNTLTAPVNFTGSVPGTIFNWTNNNPSIGLAASGTGNISSFIGTNATNSPVTATITVTPVTTGSPLNETFNYTGAMQTWTVPPGVTEIHVDAHGAQGGNNGLGFNFEAGGKGGKVIGDISVTPGTILNIFVGGTTANDIGGFNGGGNGSLNKGGGGGATDIRIGGTALGDRILVAGGGGAGGQTNNNAIGHGGGGGLTGEDGSNVGINTLIAGGGTQSAGGAGGKYSLGNCAPGTLCQSGSLGLGGNGETGTGQCSIIAGTGGGGGYYGGGGMQVNTAGGGSSYTDPSLVTNVTYTRGFQNGNGLLIITYVSPPICTGTPKTFTITVNPIPDAIVPADTAICNGTLLPTGTFNFSTVANFGFDGKILIVYSDNAPSTQLRNNLLATPGVIQVDLFDAGTGTPGLALMQQYDMVVSYNNSVYSNPTSLGNNLADYVDANGTVVIFSGGFFNSPLYRPTGRWQTENYSPYNLSGSFGTTHNLGTFTAGHPLMAGVSALTSGSHQVVSVAGGATEVAQWDNGNSLIAFKGRVVGVTALISSNIAWSGDFAKVIVNAGNWINGTTTFSWTNNNTAIGLAASGTGNSLPAFTATNVTSAPVTATITVTASNTNVDATCTDTASFTITVNPSPAPIISGNLSFCAGSSTTLDAGVFASYNWSTGATTQTINVNTPGDYTVTVTDGNGCTGSASVTVTMNLPMLCLITGGDFCPGSSTQLCAATSSSYLWSTGATTQCITVNTGGTYTVTTSNASGCTSSCSKTVITYTPPPCFITGNNFCNGDSTELCYDVTSFGNPVISYLWSTAATTECIKVATGGTYTVTVTDDNGCTSSCSKTVTEYPKPICSITGSNFCSGSGSQLCAAASIPGPSVNSYLWSTGATTQCITVTASGTYTVTVTDANGCTNSCSKTVTEYPKPPCSITGGDFCSGSGSQLCAASVPGPSINTYLWSTGATTQCITVTASGTYTITVTDANGCTNSCSKTVTEYPKPSCSITGSNFCSGSGSQLCAASVPGPSVNTYLWSTGATTQCITVTASGTYTITVTDANGCTNSCSKIVTAYPLPTCSITGDNFCSGSSSQLCAASVPGPSVNTYLWSTGATTQCITVTTSGTYTVTVTDANGCTNSCSKTVTAYPLPTCSITGGNFCQGSSTQLCAATNSNYLWSTGATTQCITVNTGGTYTVTVTDGNGCTSSCSKTVYAYQLPTCAITGNSSVCPGSTTQICGSVGSVSTYTYLWNTGATTQCITVGAGTYTVTATSTSGCTSSCSKTVTAYTLPVCTISGNIAYCEGSTTQLCGTPGMSAYLWSTGATTQCIAAAGGDYTVTVTNNNGCTSSCSITTHLRLLPVCAITGGNFCAGNSTQLCATTAPAGYVFNYAWSTGATTQCITLATGGTYTVNITNQYGCSSSCSKTITVYPTPVCAISGNIAYCQGSTTQLCAPAGLNYLWSTGATTKCIAAAGGDYTVTVTNGSGCTSSCSVTTNLRLPPVCSITGNNFCAGSSSQLCAAAAPVGYVYSYAWSTGATTQCITITAGGTYTVTISNQYGCTSSCSKAITKYALPTCSVTGSASVCQGNSTQWCAPAGLAAYLWSNGATTQCITLSTAATYTVTVTNTTGCTKSCSKALTIKALPNCTVTGNASICPGSSTQWCAPAGLAGYLWSSGATTQCITVSTAGTYTVTTTNTGGCTKSCSKTLTIKAVPTCNITGTASICPGGATQWCAPAGLAAYLWSNGATTQCISVSIAAVYTVTVTNAGGCTSSCSKTLSVKTPPSCSISGGNICQGGSAQLCASATAAGYLWSTGATTKCISVSTPGIYTVTVTNSAGCTSSCSKNVTVSSLPNCAITWNHTLCQGSSAQLCAGAGLSSYLWNTGATSQCITINATADYTVTVTNGNGCTSSCTVKSVAQPVPVCSITGNSVVSPGQTTPICAPAGLTYLWNNGATTQCRNVAAGTYTVTVTNANGCTSSCSKTVTSAAKMVEPVVIGGDNGAIEASAYPNPFNQEATIEFRNTIASGHVVVELFNLTGSKMAVLFDKDVEQNVTYQTRVHSEDLAEGVYFYRIVSGDNVITGKLILLKE